MIVRYDGKEITDVKDESYDRRGSVYSKTAV